MYIYRNITIDAFVLFSTLDDLKGNFVLLIFFISAVDRSVTQLLSNFSFKKCKEAEKYIK